VPVLFRAVPEEVDRRPYFALGEYVQSKGWGTRRLSNATEIPESTLSELFSGTGAVDFDKVMDRISKIAHAMGVSRNELLAVMRFVEVKTRPNQFTDTRDKIRVNPDLGADGQEAVGALYDYYVRRTARIVSLAERAARRRQAAAERQAAAKGQAGVPAGKADKLTGSVAKGAASEHTRPRPKRPKT
jgi:hypothetical protein